MLVTVPPSESVLGMIIALVLELAVEPELIDMLDRLLAVFVYLDMSAAFFCAVAQPASSAATAAGTAMRAAARLKLCDRVMVLAPCSRPGR
jgi:hypothetical protein